MEVDQELDGVRSLEEPLHRAVGHVAFDADDRFYPGLLCLLVKLDRPEEHAVVGESHRRHAFVACCVDEIVDSAGAVKQAVVGVIMEMDEL